MTREEVIEELNNIKEYNYTLMPTEALDMAIEALQAEPVKHGKWQITEVEGGNFCPNCGAKMDKE